MRFGVRALAKSPIVLRWLLRILGGCVTAAALMFAGLVAYFFLVVRPSQEAARQDAKHAAEAFGRLTGVERRLAIYDAFAAQISGHYYDQSFVGRDWPKLRRHWRIEAAKSADDWHLYWDVMAQLAQRFPVSHVGVEMPIAGSEARDGGQEHPNAIARLSALPRTGWRDAYHYHSARRGCRDRSG